MKNRLLALLLSLFVVPAFAADSAEHLAWKAAIRAKVDELKALMDAPVAPGCVAPDIENSSYASALAAAQSAVNGAHAKLHGLPPGCVPPPTGPVEGYLNGKTWQVGIRKAVPIAKNLSACCWLSATNTVLCSNESTLIELDIDGNPIRQIALTGAPINPTNGLPLTKKFESISLVQAGATTDRISLVYEGLSNKTPPDVTPILIEVDLPHDATSIDISTPLSIYPLTGVISNMEAHAWDETTSKWFWRRMSDDFGSLTADGTCVSMGLPPDSPRRKVRDICFNQNLSPCIFALSWTTAIVEISEYRKDTGVFVGNIDVTSLLQIKTHEGIDFTDSGSIVTVNEWEEYVRLDPVFQGSNLIGPKPNESYVETKKAVDLSPLARTHGIDLSLKP